MTSGVIRIDRHNDTTGAMRGSDTHLHSRATGCTTRRIVEGGGGLVYAGIQYGPTHDFVRRATQCNSDGVGPRVRVDQLEHRRIVRGPAISNSANLSRRITIVIACCSIGVRVFPRSPHNQAQVGWVSCLNFDIKGDRISGSGQRLLRFPDEMDSVFIDECTNVVGRPALAKDVSRCLIGAVPIII